MLTGQKLSKCDELDYTLPKWKAVNADRSLTRFNIPFNSNKWTSARQMILKSAAWWRDFPTLGFLLSSEEDVGFPIQLLQYVMALNHMLALLPALHNLQSWAAKTCFRLFSGKTSTDQQTCWCTGAETTTSIYSGSEKKERKFKEHLVYMYLYIYLVMDWFPLDKTRDTNVQSYINAAAITLRLDKPLITNFYMAHYLCSPDQLSGFSSLQKK